MNKNYKVVAVLLVAIFVLPLVASAQSMTVAQLQAEVQSLLAQLQVLQQQLAVVQGGSSATWCHVFNTNLEVGNTSPDVTALQQSLSKDGETVGVTGTFDDQTASAVTGFQQKYASQILAPSGLQNGTGYVGKATRARLNSLFGCNNNQVSTPPVTTAPPTVNPVVSPSVSLLSPNGGQTFTQNANNQISWTGGSTKVQVGLVSPNFDANNPNVLGWITQDGSPSGSVSWSATTVTDLTDTVTWPVIPGSYKILLVSMTANGNYCMGSGCNMALSSGSFNIVAASTTPVLNPSITILSPATSGGILLPGQSMSYEVQVQTSKPIGAFNLGLANINSGWPGATGNYIPLVGTNGYAAVPSGGIYSGTATYPGSLTPGNYYLYASWNSQDGSEPVYVYSNFTFSVGGSASIEHVLHASHAHRRSQ